jgi:hypothetical protein
VPWAFSTRLGGNPDTATERSFGDPIVVSLSLLEDSLTLNAVHPTVWSAFRFRECVMTMSEVLIPAVQNNPEMLPRLAYSGVAPQISP